MGKLLLVAVCALLLPPAEPADSDEGVWIFVCLEPESLDDMVILPPGGIVLDSPRAKLHRSLFSVRREFIPQLIALGDDM